MKTVIFGMLLLLGTTTLAAVTNELYPSDVASRMYPTDYGTLTLTPEIFVSPVKWDGSGDPPISVSGAINAVKKHLPPLSEEKWKLDSISLMNFDGKGWHYLVVFQNHHSFTENQLHYLVTKDYIAAVLMDGSVIPPSNNKNDNQVEQAGPGYPPQGVGSPDP